MTNALNTLYLVRHEPVSGVEFLFPLFVFHALLLWLHWTLSGLHFTTLLLRHTTSAPWNAYLSCRHRNGEALKRKPLKTFTLQNEYSENMFWICSHVPPEGAAIQLCKLHGDATVK